MTTIRAFIKSHPLLTYFALTFAISWGGVYILGAPYGMPTTSEQFAKIATAYGSYQPVRERSESPKQV